jgi:hypothetical protein
MRDGLEILRHPGKVPGNQPCHFPETQAYQTSFRKATPPLAWRVVAAIH